MVKTGHDCRTCPETEILTGIYDGEYHDESVLEHVKQCPACKEYLESLASLDRKLRSALDRNTPLSIAERCLTAVHDRLDPEKRKTPETGYRLLLLAARAVAAVVLVSLTVFLAWRSLSGNGKEGRVARSNAERRIASSAGVRASLLPVTGTEGTAGKYAELSQTWTSPGTKDPDVRKTLEKLLAENGIRGTVGISQKAFSVRFDAGRRKCMAFIRACRKKGYRPDPVQPEQKNFSGNVEEIVRYRGLFIR